MDPIDHHLEVLFRNIQNKYSNCQIGGWELPLGPHKNEITK